MQNKTDSPRVNAFRHPALHLPPYMSPNSISTILLPINLHPAKTLTAYLSPFISGRKKLFSKVRKKFRKEQDI